MDSKQYWDGKIIEWEDSMRVGKKVSLIEQLATRFRRPLLYRADLTVATLAPRIAGKRVLELGCGSGFTAFRLIEEGKPSVYTGVDISPTAVQRATSLAAEKGVGGQVTFLTGDVMHMELPEVDVVIGMGFLDYLTADEIRVLFSRLKTKDIFFSFAERRFSLLRFFHQLYLLSQHCPKHFYYTKEEMVRLVQPKFSRVHFLSDQRLSFASIIHNLELP